MSYLIHYNHNHDALGRFASNNSGVSRRAIRKLNSDRRKADEYKNRKTIKRDLVSSKVNAVLMDDKRYIEAKNKYDNATMEFEKVSDKIDFSYKNNKNKKLYDELQKKRDKQEKAFEQYNQIRREITDKYLGQYADATIKDLKIKNEPGVRDFIIRNTAEYWYDTSIFYKNNTINTQFKTDETARQKERYDRTHGKKSEDRYDNWDKKPDTQKLKILKEDRKNVTDNDVRDVMEMEIYELEQKMKKKSK
jgi:hypothetical protein